MTIGVRANLHKVRTDGKNQIHSLPFTLVLALNGTHSGRSARLGRVGSRTDIGLAVGARARASSLGVRDRRVVGRGHRGGCGAVVGRNVV